MSACSAYMHLDKGGPTPILVSNNFENGTVSPKKWSVQVRVRNWDWLGAVWPLCGVWGNTLY